MTKYKQEVERLNHLIDTKYVQKARSKIVCALYNVALDIEKYFQKK